MAKDRKPKTQKTPKGHEIPNPTKEEVFKVLRKAAEPTDKELKTPICMLAPYYYYRPT